MRIEDMTFKQIIEMRREEFDKNMTEKQNIGTMLGLSNLLKLQYEQLRNTVNALTEVHNNPETSLENKELALKTINNAYSYMFGIEYKVLILQERIKECNSQVI